MGVIEKEGVTFAKCPAELSGRKSTESEYRFQEFHRESFTSLSSGDLVICFDEIIVAEEIIELSYSASGEDILFACKRSTNVGRGALHKCRKARHRESTELEHGFHLCTREGKSSNGDVRLLFSSHRNRAEMV